MCADSRGAKPDSLESSLLQLAKESRRLLARYARQGKATRVAVPQLRARVDQFRYEEGARSFSVDHELQEWPEWDRRFVDALLEDISKHPAYSQYIRLISSRIDVSADQAGYLLGEFVRKLVSKAVQDPITDEVEQ